MSEEKLYPVFAEAAANTHLTEAQYRAMYDASIADPESFWAEQARSFLTWSTPFSSVVESNLSEGQAKWFADGSLNCLLYTSPSPRDLSTSRMPSSA